MLDSRLPYWIHLAFTATFVVAASYLTIPRFAYNYARFLDLILYAILAFFMYFLIKRYFRREKIQLGNKSVLITGCDSGFGNNLAKRLDSKGFQVFATCLFPNGPGAINLKESCSDKLHILHMDVTKEETVENAVGFVRQNLGTSTFWALVNNAGIYKGFPVEFTSVDVFKDVMEVNSIGPVRVTKAFLPLLKKSKGRVVNVTSLAGRICIMNTCAYTMSKWAAMAFTECLREEMKALEIAVISIEPEYFHTSLMDTRYMNRCMDEEFKKVSDDVIDAYGEDYTEKLKAFILYCTALKSSSPNIVVDDIESAITDKHPEAIYKPRWNMITRMYWKFTETIPAYGLAKYIIPSLIINIFGFPVPKDAKRTFNKSGYFKF